MNGRFRIAGNVGVSTGGTGQGASQGLSSTSKNRGMPAYQPPTAVLLLLVFAEVTLYGWLRYYFRHSHGG